VTDSVDLSPHQRAKLYRERAAEARSDAQRTSGYIREGYLMVESGWLSLAADAERTYPTDEADHPKHDMKLAALRAPPDRKS
jgi:hypothetical protein